MTPFCDACNIRLKQSEGLIFASGHIQYRVCSPRCKKRTLSIDKTKEVSGKLV